MTGKIDAHQHFWRYHPSQYGWIDSGGPLACDHLPMDLMPSLAPLGIDATVAVQARQSREETEWLLALADEFEWVAKVVGWDDLRAADIDARLSRWTAFPKLAGFRHVIQDEPDPLFMLQPAFVRGVRAVLEAGFTYDVLVRPPQHGLLSEFLEAVGEGRLVLNHGAKPGIQYGNPAEWAAAMKSAATFPHLYCKVSGLITEADHANWRPEDIRPYLEHLMDCFGPDRLMFGSDWPVCQLAGSYAAVCGLVDDFVRQYCPEKAEAIWSANAARFYGISCP